MNPYQFEKIAKTMRKKYGTIPPGQEEQYHPILQEYPKAAG